MKDDIRPPTPLEAQLFMPIEDVLSLAAAGVVAVGTVERGHARVGDEVELVGVKPTRKALIFGIERDRTQVREAAAGDRVGVLLRAQGLRPADVARGAVLAEPGAVKPFTRFKAELALPPARVTPGYRPELQIRFARVVAVVKPLAGAQPADPGGVVVEIELIVPIAMEGGDRFEILDGGSPVGTGIVLTPIS